MKIKVHILSFFQEFISILFIHSNFKSIQRLNGKRKTQSIQ